MIRIRIPIPAHALWFVVFASACHKDPPIIQASTVPASETATASVAPLPSSPGGARTYAIHLRRPAHVGDRSHVVVDADYTEHTVATLAGQPPTDKKKAGHVHVDGTDVVKELQADGVTTLRNELTVIELWQTLDDGSKEVLAPKGSHLEILRAAKKDDARITIGGRSVSKAVREALAHATDLTTTSGASDDEILGTTTEQPVGGEWGINVTLAEKDLVARDMSVAPGSVTGKTKLVAVRAVNGVDCLELDNTLMVGSITSMKELPPGSTVEKASVTTHLHLLVPIDRSRDVLEASMDIAVGGTFVVPSPKGPVRVVLESGDHKRVVSVIDAAK